MTTPPTACSIDTIDRLARKRAGRKIGWTLHALVFIAVNGGLAAMALAHGRPWLMGTFFGWGLGLLVHGVAVYLLPDGSGWRERLVQRERERLLQQHR
jgi:hypothetical protein